MKQKGNVSIYTAIIVVILLVAGIYSIITMFFDYEPPPQEIEVQIRIMHGEEHKARFPDLYSVPDDYKDRVSETVEPEDFVLVNRFLGKQQRYIEGQVWHTGVRKNELIYSVEEYRFVPKNDGLESSDLKARILFNGTKGVSPNLVLESIGVPVTLVEMPNGLQLQGVVEEEETIVFENLPVRLQEGKYIIIERD